MGRFQRIHGTVGTDDIAAVNGSTEWRITLRGKSTSAGTNPTLSMPFAIGNLILSG